MVDMTFVAAAVLAASVTFGPLLKPLQQLRPRNRLRPLRRRSHPPISPRSWATGR